MLLLIRRSIRRGVKVTDTDDPDILGITLNKDFFNMPEDLHVWFTYAPPVNSPYAKNKGNTIQKLEEKLARGAGKKHYHGRPQWTNSTV